MEQMFGGCPASWRGSHFLDSLLVRLGTCNSGTSLCGQATAGRECLPPCEGRAYG